MSNDPIFDRTQADVDYALVNQGLTTDALKGAIDYRALNRIESNIKSIVESINNFGYKISIVTETDWAIEDDLYLSDLERIRTNLNEIKNVWFRFSGNELKVWTAETSLTYVDLNDIEKLTYDMIQATESILKTIVHSGSFLAEAPVMFFPQKFVKTSQTFLENGTFVVPEGITSLEVHLVGGGGGGSGAEEVMPPWDYYYGQSMYGMGGGGGYTTTATIDVTPGEVLSITVGRGGTLSSYGGATSISNNSGDVLARAGGGEWGQYNLGGEGSEYNPNVYGGNGGSGGGGGAIYNEEEPQLIVGKGGTDGSSGGSTQGYNAVYVNNYGAGGQGQGRTTRDFGEPTGTMRARGGDSYYEGVHEANPPRPNHGDGGNGIYWEPYTPGGQSELANGSSGIAIVRWEAE